MVRLQGAGQEHYHIQQKWICLAIITYLIIVFRITSLQQFGNYAVALTVFFVVLRQRWFEWKWLGYIGEISFCIYLFHRPIRDFFQLSVNNSYTRLFLVLFFSLIASAIINKVIEVPFIKVGRRLAERSGSNQSP